MDNNIPMTDKELLAELLQDFYSDFDGNILFGMCEDVPLKGERFIANLKRFAKENNIDL